MIQQGDVLLKRISMIPVGAKRLKHKTLAEGEATGHSHTAVEDSVRLYERDGVLYMDAPEGGTITHQEHKPVTLPPGKFQVGIVKEYDYDTEESRRVMD